MDYESLVKCLMDNTCPANIHDVNMLVKEIPDPVEDRPEGSLLDPRVFAWRKLAEEAGNPFAGMEELPVDLIRQAPAYPSIDLVGDKASVEERVIKTRHGEISIFLIQPSLESSNPGKKRPLLMYYHGGAFIAGCTEVCIPLCKLIALQADALVIGVDYHLSPEHYFPVGLEDCYDSLDWAISHADELSIDTSNITVSGDSAGGTLAIGVCMLEQQALQTGKIDKYRISRQALIYPAVLVDNKRLEDYKWRLSMYEIPGDDIPAMGAAMALKALTDMMAMLYTGKPDSVENPLAAPLLAEDLSYLPRTITFLCEFDFLRLQGEAFVRKITRDGVDAVTYLYKGMDHEFIDRVGYCPQAEDLASIIAKDIKGEV